MSKQFTGMIALPSLFFYFGTDHIKKISFCSYKVWWYEISTRVQYKAKKIHFSYLAKKKKNCCLVPERGWKLTLFRTLFVLCIVFVYTLPVYNYCTRYTKVGVLNIQCMALLSSQEAMIVLIKMFIAAWKSWRYTNWKSSSRVECSKICELIRDLATLVRILSLNKPERM